MQRRNNLSKNIKIYTVDKTLNAQSTLQISVNSGTKSPKVVAADQISKCKLSSPIRSTKKTFQLDSARLNL